MPNTSKPFTVLKAHAGLTPDALKIIYGKANSWVYIAALMILIGGTCFALWAMNLAGITL